MSDLETILRALDTAGHAPVEKRAITNHAALNEAYSYQKPSSFSRHANRPRAADDPAHLRYCEP